ncbi:20997_t:CDS:2 [Entrophospora sp. SA101]|nr:20997_t:CDS:2 [Entrophospora sp. SA101]
MFKKTFPKYLLIALAIIFCFHFLFTYFNPSVKNPWSIITEDHYIDSGKDAPIINNEKATNNKISTGPRTITKSIFKTKILTMTSTVTVENTIQPTQVQEEEIKQTETFEKEEPTKQETIPPRKAKAAFVVLIRNDDLKSFRYTMVQLEQRFNRKYKYPYVFLNDVPFTEEFMNQTRSLTEANCEFVEHWSVPSSIDKELMESAMKQMAEERVIYGGSLNYRHMCRFESGFFYRHELLKNYDYYWRVEPGVDFYCNIDFDPFLYMQDNDIKYGFTISLYEYPRTIESLWGTVKEFIEMYPEYIEEDNWMDFVSNDEGATYNFRNKAISPGNLPKPLTPEHQNLGDLIISIPYVINWCKRNNKYYTTCHSFKKTKRCLNIEKRLIELYVHGVLHLLGYDHESDDDYLMMNMKEKEMLKQFWKWKKDSRNRK